jgi:hypothetical protein
MLPDLKRLHMLFGAMYRANDGERNAAASKFYLYLVDHHLHPDGITLSVGNDLIAQNRNVINRLQTELIRVHNENSFLRRHADGKILADAIKSREVDYQWFALEDLARERLGDEQGALPRHWRSIVAKQAHVTPYQMQRWEQGTALIPEAVFLAVQALPVINNQSLPERRQKRSKIVKGSPDKYLWPEPVLRSIIDLWLRGASKPSILAAAETGAGSGVITQGMITNKIEHSPPPDFLATKVRPTGEPIDWPELWLLGATLFRGTANGGKRQRGWRTAALAKLGLHSAHNPPNDLNIGTTQAAIDALRTQYVQHNLSQEKVKAVPDLYKPLLDMMLSVGPEGATRPEVSHRIGNKHLRRISEAQKSLLVFDSGLRRQTDVIYIHNKFADSHLTAWQTARRRYSNDPATQTD